jgi:hypothetical protein
VTVMAGTRRSGSRISARRERDVGGTPITVETAAAEIVKIVTNPVRLAALTQAQAISLTTLTAQLVQTPQVSPYVTPVQGVSAGIPGAAMAESFPEVLA